MNASRFFISAPILPSKLAHAYFYSPFLCCNGCGLTQNLSGDKINGKFWNRSDISIPMHGYNHLFGREMARIQPPPRLTPWRFVLGTKPGRKW